MRSGKSHFTALALLAGLTVLVSWPLAADLGDTLPVAANSWLRADIELLVWILSWTSRTIVTAPLEVFEATVFHPAPLALTASENLIGLTPISTPTLLASGSPVFTYNFTLLAVTFLTAATAYWAVRDFEDSLLAGVLAGSLLAFDPQLIHEWARLHESAVSLFPLVFLLSFRVARKPSAGNFAALVVATSIQILAGVYLAFILGAFAAGLAPGLVWQARQSGRNGALPLTALLLGTIIPGLVSIPYFTRQSGGTYPELQQAMEIASLYSYAPGESLRALASGTGILAAPLALVGLANRHVPAVIRASLLLALGLGVLIAAGPMMPLIPGTEIPGVYWGLASIVPGFSTMRAPARFLVIGHICLTLLAGFGVGNLVRLARPRLQPMAQRITGGMLVAASVIVILFTQAGWPIAVSRVPDGPFFTGAYKWLAENAEEGAVLELPAMQSPLERKRLAQTGRAMRGSLLHGLPLINGYSGHPPPTHALLTAWAQRIPQNAALEDFCRYTDLRWLIVHYGIFEGNEPELDSALTAWGLTQRRRFGRDVIYEVPLTCGRDTDELRTYALAPGAQTLQGVPMRSLGAEEKRGTIEVALPEAWQGNSVQWVDLSIRNDSDVVWPGMTTDRPHAISINSRWVSDTGAVNPCCSLPMLLGRDLAPGDTLTTPFLLYAPVKPGDWTLEIGLSQKGFGWFGDTGGTALLRHSIELFAPGTRNDADGDAGVQVVQ